MDTKQTGSGVIDKKDTANGQAASQATGQTTHPALAGDAHVPRPAGGTAQTSQEISALACVARQIEKRFKTPEARKRAVRYLADLYDPMVG